MKLTLGQRIKYNYREHRTGIYITLFILLFLFLYLLPNMLVFVEAGRKGVRFRRFGHGVELNRIYAEGPHLIYPWDTMTMYDVRVFQISTEFVSLAEDGLQVKLDASIRFYPLRDLSLARLHQEVGPEYVDRVVIPEAQAGLRRIMGSLSPHELYRTQLLVSARAQAEVAPRLAARYIYLDDLLIKSVELPPTVQAAIQSKLVADQAAQEMVFRIARETREKERKSIEAEGLRIYNETIGSSLTDNADNILRYKSIEAFLELSKYGNSNTIVFGAPGSLPFVMDLSKTALRPPGALPPIVAPGLPAPSAGPPTGAPGTAAPTPGSTPP